MSQRVKKSLTITAFIIGIFIVSAILVMFVIPSTADEQGVTYELIGDGTMRAGRYYHNGDKESFYYEIFDDRTIQLGGIDPVDYVIMVNCKGRTHDDPDDPEHKKWWESIYSSAEIQGARKSYVAMVINWPDYDPGFMLTLNYHSIDELLNSQEGGWQYYEYIDEKTIGYGDYVFRLVE
ncbi:MAG: hypothetical protein FWG70_08900 [Oscillospiraceae bacterium]|nr:hypothetical protein [Oscillospiraceae bacterium]